MSNIKLNCLGQMDNSDGTIEMRNRVYDTNFISSTLNTTDGGGVVI